MEGIRERRGRARLHAAGTPAPDMLRHAMHPSHNRRRHRGRDGRERGRRGASLARCMRDTAHALRCGWMPRHLRRGRRDRVAAMTHRGFTLIELLVVMVALAVLLAGLAVPIAAQVQMRRQDETRRLLDEARDAILGFAASNGRLPCPATEDSGGTESFTATGNVTNG